MGQNKAFLGYFLVNVHKWRNYNSCNALNLRFNAKKRSIFYILNDFFDILWTKIGKQNL